MLIDRITKLVVTTWMLGAIAAIIWLTGGWPALKFLAPTAAVLAGLVTWWSRPSVGFVLACSYIFPALVTLLHGPYHVYYTVLWTAALAGALFPAAIGTGWHIPHPWRIPLVFWALVIVVGSSIVGLRELDFTLELIHSTTVANTPGGGWPAFWLTWILHVAVGLLVGILLFDWLLDLPREAFHRAVAMPLAGGVVLMVAAAIYQMSWDMSFLNATVFQNLGRASGTLQDANVCGTIAALWIGGVIVWSEPFQQRRGLIRAVGMLGCWLAVWASGSRTAFAAALLVSAFALADLYRAASAKRSRGYFGLGAAAMIGVLLVIASAFGNRAVGPMARILDSIDSVQSVSVAAIGGVLEEQLWRRNGYGSAAAAMIREHPLFGVGAGSFQMILPEFSVHAGGPLSPDNAQNWYRHQLAEYGVVGSLGWIAWLVTFGAFVLRRRFDSPVASSARGMLVALAAISFVGMPGQDVAVSTTFWVIAAWVVLCRAPEGSTAGATNSTGHRSAATAKTHSSIWLALLVVVGLFGAGTLHAALNDMRVPMRARRVGWPYEYGLYGQRSERDDGFRWTGNHAVVVMRAAQPYVEVTLSADHKALMSRSTEDAAHARIRPTVVRLWRDGELVIDRELTTTAPVTTYLPVRGETPWVFLETDVSRLLRPKDLGIADDRELGIRLRWAFVDRPGESR
jgi:hypothetical protein